VVQPIAPIKKKSQEFSDAAAGGLPMQIWDHVVGFLDIPELGTCARVSNGLHAAVMKDATWEVHVKKLLQKLFDGAFYIEPKERSDWVNHCPVPISMRPLKSTNFRSWYTEWTSPFMVNFHGEPRCRTWYMFISTAVSAPLPRGGQGCRWLFQDVPLRSYFKEAGTYAYLGYEQKSQGNSGGFTHDYDGVPLGVDPNMFRGLPNIRLFHGLGGYHRARHYDDEYYYGDY